MTRTLASSVSPLRLPLPPPPPCLPLPPPLFLRIRRMEKVKKRRRKEEEEEGESPAPSSEEGPQVRPWERWCQSCLRSMGKDGAVGCVDQPGPRAKACVFCASNGHACLAFPDEVRDLARQAVEDFHRRHRRDSRCAGASEALPSSVSPASSHTERCSCGSPREHDLRGHR